MNTLVILNAYMTQQLQVYDMYSEFYISLMSLQAIDIPASSLAGAPKNEQLELDYRVKNIEVSKIMEVCRNLIH